MKTLPITSFFLLIALAANTQVYWEGNTPGSETDWMEPQNWSAGQVPGWKDDVVIPWQSHGLYPEVSCVAPLIQSLQVQKGAALTIQPEGVLTVDAAEKEEGGILLNGYLFNFGVLTLTEMELAPVESQLSHLDNHGVCSLVTDDGHIPLLARENQ